MTVIVGVICTDGIVIGTDSSATFTAGQFKTIEQRTKKVFVIGTNVLLAATGSVGLSQRFEDVVRNYWAIAESQGKSHFEITCDLHQLARNNFARTGENFQQIGACMGFCLRDQMYLCEFASQTFSPEFKSPDMWFVSMGSGQLIADPFLGFVRKIFWGDEQPSLRDGIFGTILALNHAIDVNPGGIGGPVQIGIIESHTMTSRILDEAEMAEHHEHVEHFESYMKRYKQHYMETVSPHAIPALTESPSS